MVMSIVIIRLIDAEPSAMVIPLPRSTCQFDSKTSVGCTRLSVELLALLKR